MSALRQKWSKNAFTLGLIASLAGTALPAYADETYLGEIIVFGFDFCPNGFASASGQILPINQNQAMFSLIGTVYGGDGITTFALPDVRGRKMMGISPSHFWGERAGSQAVTLTIANLPPHSHLVNVNNLDGDQADPSGKLLAAAPPNGTGSETIYSEQPANRVMKAEMIGFAGSSQPLDVVDPTLGMTVCMALQGIYPSRD